MGRDLIVRSVIPDRVTYVEGFLPELDAAWLLQWVRDTSNWSQERLSIRDISVPFPRLVAWHGDPGVGYRYSGIEHPAAAWTEPLAIVRDRVTAMTGMRPNGVLCNRYRTGADSIGRHADREDDLIEGSPIVGVSLGVERTISFRSMKPMTVRMAATDKPKYEKRELALEDGSALIMYGDCQKTWTHEIKKDHSVTGERISLTFRMVKT